MKIKLLGENILVPEIVAQASQGRRVVERKRPKAAILRKVDGQMAGNPGAAAIADKDNLVAGVMCVVSGFADPLASIGQRQVPRRVIGNFRSPQ